MDFPKGFKPPKEYADIDNCDDFEYRCSMLELETVDDFRNAVKHGDWPKDMTLGEQFTAMSFYCNEELAMYFEGCDEYETVDEAVGSMSRYGITLDSHCVFFQGMDENGLLRMVNRHAKSGRPWNPGYARPEIPEEVADFCRHRSVKDLIVEFSMAGRVERIGLIVDDIEFDGNVELGQHLKLNDYGAVFPFTGWQLARCFEIAATETGDPLSCPTSLELYVKQKVKGNAQINAGTEDDDPDDGQLSLFD